MPAVVCPHCGAKLNVSEAALGKNGRCPKCQEKFLVQLPAAVDEYDLAPQPQVARTPEPTIARPIETISKPATAVKTKQPAENAALPAWAIPAAIGGGVLALLVCAGLIYGAYSLLSGGAGRRLAENLTGTSPTIDISRDPEPGDYSWVPKAPIADADPATWKVAVQGVELPTGLKSVFPLPHRDHASVHFTPALGSKAAVLVPLGRGLQWTQYDLKKTDPVQVTLAPEAATAGSWPKFVAALNTSGTLLAVRNHFRPEDEPGHVLVFKDDGAKLASIAMPAETGEIQWLALPSDDLLLAYDGTKIAAHRLPAGDKVYEIEGVQYLPAVSPGGKYVAVLTEQGMAWHSIADGQTAGLLPLPEKWFEHDPQRGGRNELIGKRWAQANFHPNGKCAAILAINPHSDLHIANVDLATGNIKEAFQLTHSRTQSSPELAGIWTGERQMLLSDGMVVDFDLKTFLLRYEVGFWPGQSPDGRYWRAHRLKYDQVDDVIAKMGETMRAEDVRRNEVVLAATTLPEDSVVKQLADARQGFIWRADMEARLEIAGNVPNAEREATIDAFAAAVAKRGVRINPQAKYGVRLNIGVDDDLVVGKTEAAYDPNYQKEFYEQGKVGKMRVSVVNEAGEPQLAAGSVQVDSTYESGGADRVWRELRARLKDVDLPRTYFRDTGGKRLPISLPGRQIPVGIDGVLEAINTDAVPGDRYGLQKDLGY